jgi:hypothetical protein
MVLIGPLEPARARIAKTFPVGDWVYEPKWGGFRCVLFRHGADVHLQSRALNDLTRGFPEIVAAVLRNGKPAPQSSGSSTTSLRAKRAVIELWSVFFSLNNPWKGQTYFIFRFVWLPSVCVEGQRARMSRSSAASSFGTDGSRLFHLHNLKLGHTIILGIVPGWPA